MSKLTELANKLLRDHGSAAAATKPFAVALRADAEMLEALAQHYLEQTAPHSTARQRTGPHRRPQARKAKLPTAAQRKASLAVTSKVVVSILDARKLRDGRAIGDVRFLELSQLATASAMKGADFLRRGFEDVVDAVACKLLSNHAIPSLPDAKVRDVMKAKDVEAAYLKARQIAADRVAHETARVARNYEEAPAQITG